MSLVVSVRSQLFSRWRYGFDTPVTLTHLSSH